MLAVEFMKRVTGGPARFSYLFIAGIVILAGWLHLATCLVVALFAYFALTKLTVGERWNRWVAVACFLVLFTIVSFLLGRFVNHTVRALPEIANKAIPSVIEFAADYEIQLPFTDYQGLKESGFEIVKRQTDYLRGAARFARDAGKQLILFIVGVVVAIGIFINPNIEPGRRPDGSNNLYSVCCHHVALRFRNLFQSFATVMGAQLIISAINTVLTGIFVVAVDLPYATVIIGVTFLCGLVPILGNLVSNTIIVGVGFTVSPKLAIAALAFLVIIHKLEYFLNSKIIGDRIRYPLWLTLLGLILGERLMGIPGMILAPVILNYVRLEAAAIQVEQESTASNDD